MEVIYQKIENIIERIVSNLKGEEIQSQLLISIVDELGSEIGITGGRLWQLDLNRRDYVLVKKYKGKKQVSIGFRIPESYPPIQTLRKEGCVFRQKWDKSLDRSLEDKLGVEDFVAVAIGIDAFFIASFDTVTKIASNKRVELMKRQEGALRRIARVAAIALNNAYRHQQALRERDFAYHILLDMLPDHQPRFSGFDIHGKTLFSTKVGGDYYNFIKLPNGHMDIVIADAKGHGLEAAGTISLLHNALLRSMVRMEAQIDEVVDNLNKKLLKRTSEDNFVTMFYGELSPEGNLIYCNAGHVFPLLFHQGEGYAMELTNGGLILGVSESADYEIGCAHIAEGGVLVQYTDGIVETMNHGKELFGVERLKDIVWENYFCTAEEIASKLLEAAEAFSGTQRDDMTVVVVKRLFRR